jgi:hypothetical protein
MIAVTDAQTVTPVLFRELFWSLPCASFTEMKPPEDDFIGRTVTNLQLFCHFIDSHPPVVEN